MGFTKSDVVSASLSSNHSDVTFNSIQNIILVANLFHLILS